jgi:hypothetical protein
MQNKQEDISFSNESEEDRTTKQIDMFNEYDASKVLLDPQE